MLNYIRIGTLLATLSLVSTGSWAANKCVGPNGKAIFQDAPCAGAGATVREDLAIKEQQRIQRQAEMDRVQEDIRERETAQRAAFDKEIASQIARNSERARRECGRELRPMPTIGMTEHAFRNCTSFGIGMEPSQINETQTTSGVTRQYVYLSPFASARFVYTRSGLVTAIQY